MLENVIYKELLIHNYNVKVGTFNQVEKNNNKSILKTYEVDFYATKGTDTLYLQVTDNIDEENLKLREITPFKFIRDSNMKIILVNRPIQKMKLENGIIVWGIIDFLLNLN